MKIIEFIGEKAYYDKECWKVFGEDKNGGMKMLLDVRGWGVIQKLFKNEDEACEFQDSLGAFIAEAINEKLEREIK